MATVGRRPFADCDVFDVDARDDAGVSEAESETGAGPVEVTERE